MSRYEMIERNGRLFSQYRPIDYSGKVHLIRASLNNYRNKYLGWDEVATNVSVSQTQGNHFTLINRPLVNGLARIMNKLLKRS
jgi:thioesterase domain-containing protein